MHMTTGKWLHEGGTRRLCTGGAQTTTVSKVRCRGTVKIGKMYYSLGWLLKMVSTGQVIVLEVD